jgi:hypothetical protein
MPARWGTAHQKHSKNLKKNLDRRIYRIYTIKNTEKMMSTGFDKATDPAKKHLSGTSIIVFGFEKFI